MSDSKLHRFWPAVIRRLHLAKWFNYNHPLMVAGQKFVIPILGGVGETLLKLEPDFKSEVIRMFGKDLPNCFIDVGANLGQTIIEAFAQRKWEAYYALEPSPFVCTYLEALVDANHLPVTVLPWAAGLKAVPHNFCAQGPADASATLAPEGRPGLYLPGMSKWVATYPLDLLMDFDRLPPGLMIKIDVEGFEADVLAGANRILADLRPVILCEVLRAYHPSQTASANERMSKLEAILTQHRFRIFYIEMENEMSGPIKRYKEISSFPRELWRDNPSGVDYLFFPAEKSLPKSGFISLVA